jgi:hypothetical protein
MDSRLRGNDDRCDDIDVAPQILSKTLRCLPGVRIWGIGEVVFALTGL